MSDIEKMKASTLEHLQSIEAERLRKWCAEQAARTGKGMDYAQEIFDYVRGGPKVESAQAPEIGITALGAFATKTIRDKALDDAAEAVKTFEAGFLNGLTTRDGLDVLATEIRKLKSDPD